MVEQVDRAPDDAEEVRELTPSQGASSAPAASVEKERGDGYGGVGVGGRTFEPRVRLVEGEQEAAVQDGGDAVGRPVVRAREQRRWVHCNAGDGLGTYGSTNPTTYEDWCSGGTAIWDGGGT